MLRIIETQLRQLYELNPAKIQSDVLNSNQVFKQCQQALFDAHLSFDIHNLNQIHFDVSDTDSQGQRHVQVSFEFKPTVYFDNTLRYNGQYQLENQTVHIMKVMQFNFDSVLSDENIMSLNETIQTVLNQMAQDKIQDLNPSFLNNNPVVLKQIKDN